MRSKDPLPAARSDSPFQRLTILLTVLTVFTACTANRCGRKSEQRVGLSKPDELGGPYVSSTLRGAERALTTETVLRPPILGVPLTRLVAPEPIPDRLLVKIAPSEIANPFQLPSANAGVGRLVSGRSVGSVEITQVDHLGFSRDQNVVLSLQLASPQTRSTLVSAFRRLGVRLIESPALLDRDEPAQSVLVELPADAGLRWLATIANYPYLRKASGLNHVFRKHGVVSMRRVFRMVERRVPDQPGTFIVRPFEDFLDFAKQANPQRAARRYHRVETLPTGLLPDSLDPDRAMRAEELLDGLSVRERILGNARTGEGYEITVADNMENWFILRLRPGVSPNEVLAALENRSTIQRASLDYPLKMATLDTEWDDQWGLKNNGTFRGAGGGVAGFDINIEPAWGAGSPTQPVVVSVIDTGINEALGEISPRLWTNPGETPDNDVDDDCNGYVDDVHGITTFDRFAINYGIGQPCTSVPGGPAEVFTTHGTKMAGVIAAMADNNVGIAGTAGTDNVQLMNIALGTLSDRLWPPGFSDFAEALAYSISPSFPDTGAAGAAVGADIVNMSFSAGGANWLAVETTIAALDAGLILVAGTGNEDLRFDRTETLAVGVFPASFPGVIAVGGATRFDRRYSSSNYGPGMDLVAPAEEVRTTSFDAANPLLTTIVTGEGTSYATAFVSGGAAVVLGRFPYMTAPYMRFWLRAKARDMLDPEGDGSTHTGDDEWTGAGMLDVGSATTSLANADDQPLEVEIRVERGQNYTTGRIGGFVPLHPFAVGGRPDLAIRVQGSTLQDWSLSYGSGDAPTSWTPISVPSSVRDQPSDYAMSAWDITPSNSYLNADALNNKEMYTIRLVAENQAGTQFIAYDWFVPTRVSINFPGQNWTLMPDRGWLPMGAYIDTRTSSSYTVSVLDASDQPVWTGPTYGLPYTPYTAGRPISVPGAFIVMNASASPYSDPKFPQTSPFPSEGWYKYKISVSSPAGTDEDTVAMYVDASNFSPQFWDLKHDAVDFPVWGDDYALDQQPISLVARHLDSLLVLEEQATTSPRLLVKAGKTVLALDGSGALVWENRPLRGPPFHFRHDFSENIEVDTVDGEQVVLFAANEDDGTGERKFFVHLLNLDDGTPLNAAWPVESTGTIPDYVGFADVAGNSEKEILVAERRGYYFGIPASDLTGPRVRALRPNGAERWNTVLNLEAHWPGQLHFADVDADGKDEILCEFTGQILDGDGQFLPNWSTRGSFSSADFVSVTTGATPLVALLGFDGAVHLKDSLGAALSGWPIASSGIGVTAGQVVAGGDEEIIVWGSKINVYDTAGNTPAGIPEIDLNGSCSRLLLMDVDGDNTDEFVTLVNRFNDNPGPTDRVGSFLEVYEFDGTRFAVSDNRWPIEVPFPEFLRHPTPADIGGHVTLGDVDGDGTLDVVQLLRIHPWATNIEAPSARIEIRSLN